MDMQTWRDSRAEADAAVRSIQDALASLGAPEPVIRSVRAIVTRFGRAYVDLGTHRPDAVERIAEALRTSPHISQEPSDDRPNATPPER